MLFNSHVFIFCFLPIAVFGYYAIGKANTGLALLWLTSASLVFYSWWDVSYLPLIIFSICFNYITGILVSRRDVFGLNFRYYALIVGIIGNLGLLGYFKYANFIVDNANIVLGTNWTLQYVILPLAISFFTFQQISYLIDCFRLGRSEGSFVRFALFVTFFPQLIAGPIVHHKEMLPQFTEVLSEGFKYSNLAMGLTCFFIGLFKKAVIADGIAMYATPTFNYVSAGGDVSFFGAWQGALCFTFQMYFDFSGYSDMALGLALMFGIRLPLNFASPLKSSSMIEFWRRWHMTLGRFLQAYLFQPFSLIELRKRWWSQPYFAFIATMLLGGLWHGANWTFVVWGLMHGLFLAINQGWRVLKKSRGWAPDSARQRWLYGYPLTFLVVVVTLTVFRSDNIGVAGDMLSAMAGFNGIALNEGWTDWTAVAWLVSMGLEVSPSAGRFVSITAALWVIVCAVIVWVLPNTYQLFEKEAVALETYRLEPWWGERRFVGWRPTPAWMLGTVAIALLGIDALNNVSEFLYFQF